MNHSTTNERKQVVARSKVYINAAQANLEEVDLHTLNIMEAMRLNRVLTELNDCLRALSKLKDRGQ